MGLSHSRVSAKAGVLPLRAGSTRPHSRASQHLQVAGGVRHRPRTLRGWALRLELVSAHARRDAGPRAARGRSGDAGRRGVPHAGRPDQSPAPLGPDRSGATGQRARRAARQARPGRVPALSEAAVGAIGADPQGRHERVLPDRQRPHRAAGHRRRPERRARVVRLPGAPPPAAGRRPRRPAGRGVDPDPRSHAVSRNDSDHRHGVRGLIHWLFSAHSHDPADSIDNALESSAQGIRAVKISLIGLGATAILQLVIVAVSGSVALLADTVHNFSDALTAIPLWIAFALSRRSATRRYTYGFGRAEDLAGLFIVAMIASSAVFAGVESVRRLIEPVTITHVWWLSLIHISEPTRLGMISYAVFCLKKK